MKTKQCSNKNCFDPIKPSSEFCKEQLKEYNKKWYLKNKIKKLKQQKAYNLKNKVKIEKRRSKLYIENKEILRERSKNFYEINKDKISLQTKKYRLKNKDKINKYYVDRRKTDINFKLIGNLRARLNIALKKNIKSLSTIQLIGCSIEQLKEHLESQFTDEMSWDNHGRGWDNKKEWHIDHIKPCASFTLTKPSEQEKCFNYTNLQPLWAIDNIKKGSKF